MAELFRPVRAKKVYEEVLEQLKQLVGNGHLRPGDRLPPERALAEQLRVSRASIREAFSVLETLGVIENRPGGGKFIRPASWGAVLDTLALTLVRDYDTVFEFLEVRTALEAESARLAALRASADDLRELDAVVERMRRDLEAGELGDEADMEFHFALARAAGNPILLRVMNTISDFYRETLRSSRIRLYALPGSPSHLYSQHARVYEAVLAREPEVARSRMVEHLSYVRQALEQLRPEPTLVKEE